MLKESKGTNAAEWRGGGKGGWEKWGVSSWDCWGGFLCFWCGEIFCPNSFEHNKTEYGHCFGMGYFKKMVMSVCGYFGLRVGGVLGWYRGGCL